MYRLFLGLCLVLPDISVEIGRMQVDLLPDFLGWLLVMKGMQSLAGEYVAYDRGRHWAFVLSIAAVLLSGAKLFAADAMTRVWLWALGLGMLAATLCMLGLVRRGLEETGKKAERIN